MGRFYSDKEKEEWRRKSGFRTTRSVIEEEREAREKGVRSTPISMREAEELMAGGGPGSDVNDVNKRLLEEVIQIKQFLLSGQLGTLG